MLLPLVRFLSNFLYINELLKRNRLIRRILVFSLLGMTAVVHFFGWEVLGTIFLLGFRLLFAMMFMVIQFVAMFWFLARSKSVEVHPDDPKVVTFDDYWGNEHIVKEVQQWNILLTERGKFKAMGGKPISGMLLYGPPGTGKTMLAKAMAGSGGVAFYGVEGSSFRAMFIGVDILKMMSFFKKLRTLAKQYGAVIGYMDEIDAVGMTRGAVMRSTPVHPMMMGAGMGMGSGALTRLLYELDGLDETPLKDQVENRVRKWFGYSPIDQGVIFIMGATNRPEVLDPALLRPGRLDKKIEIGYPDKLSREKIIRGYLGKVSHRDDIDVASLVEDTPHASPAQIMSALTKDAVRRAHFDGRDRITQEDVEMAFQEQVLGLANPIADLDPEQKWQIAVHEAGHAVACHYLNPHKRIVRLSIIRRSGALGYVMPVDKTDVYTMPLEHLITDIMVSLAGHVATKVVLRRFWTGASGDLMAVRARMLALVQHGVFGSFPMDAIVSQNTQSVVDRFLNECMEKVEALLLKHLVELEIVARALYEQEDMSGDKFLEILQGVGDGKG